MRPENILQSDVLDIIFENKNKAYGAYNLRRNYNKRLLQSIGVTCMVVLAVAAVQTMKPEDRILGGLQIDSTILVMIPPAERPKDPVKPQETKPLQNVATVNDNPIVVVPDVDVNDSIPTVDDLANNTLGNTNKPGIVDGTVDVDPGPSITNGGDEPPVENTEPPFDDETVRIYADVMPEFPGGMEALKKFLYKNLRQPDDMEAGDRLIVKVKFVVNKNGDIDNIEVIQSGRQDLDKEVVRVVKKMPRWKAGEQNKRPVPVIFNLPVTFVGHEE